MMFPEEKKLDKYSTRIIIHVLIRRLRGAQYMSLVRTLYDVLNQAPKSDLDALGTANQNGGR